LTALTENFLQIVYPQFLNILLDTFSHLKKIIFRLIDFPTYSRKQIGDILLPNLII